MALPRASENPSWPSNHRHPLRKLLSVTTVGRVSAHHGIDIDVNHFLPRWGLGMALMGLGKHEDAIVAFERATDGADGHPFPRAFLGWALGLAGRKSEARMILADFRRRREQEHVSGWLLSHVHLGLGDREQALVSLLQAADDKDAQIAFISEWMPFNPLRSESRFQALLRRMNLPQNALRG